MSHYKTTFLKHSQIFISQPQLHKRASKFNKPRIRLFENALKNVAIFPELEIDPDQISLQGIVSVDGIDAYEIKWSDNKTVFYAVEDFLKLQTVETMEMQGQIQSSTTSFSDYKAVEGIRFPHLVKQDMGPQKIDFQVKQVLLVRYHTIQ